MKKGLLRSVLAVLVVLLVAFLAVGSTVPAAAPDMVPMLRVRAEKTVPSAPTGFSPSQIRAAYGVVGNGTAGSTAAALADDGAGKTIAVVIAYGSPNLASDLATFDSYYKIPAPPSLTIVKQATKIVTNSGWALECALDVQWAHAMAPGAKLIVVVAKSASVADLMWAVDKARELKADILSMSWGANEFLGETAYDAHFPASGPLYVASSGDVGGVVIWPAAIPQVIAVGGTSLYLNAGAYGSEKAWADAGGGVSAYETRPAWQNDIGIDGTRNATPDVALVADPATGVSVYSSVAYNGRKGWFTLGGTSVSAPCWAGLLAIGLVDGLSPTGTEALLYQDSLVPGAYHDITEGSNGYPADAWYDLVTGVGTPVTVP